MMVRSRSLFVRWLALLLVSFTLSSCTQEVEGERTRPKDVPVHAIWVGGIDGGVYAIVKKSEGLYDVVVYYENGEVAYSGKMRLISDTPQAIDFDDAQSYLGWDGDTMYLINEQRLVMTKE
ncbi:hypothetical protein ACJJIK_07230 [Microbulbifer sp. ZKSA006]|uniref:hypothetical protein n=1 Tax=Microbulbifer sp. ZKSA006 TaxID=3243390 RepID=UPI004039E544